MILVSRLTTTKSFWTINRYGLAKTCTSLIIMRYAVSFTLRIIKVSFAFNFCAYRSFICICHNKKNNEYVEHKKKKKCRYNKYVCHMYVPPAREKKEELVAHRMIRHARSSTLAMVGGKNFLLFLLIIDSTNFRLSSLDILAIQSRVYIH